MRKSFAFVFTPAFVGCMIGSVRASSLLINGDFESHPNPDSSPATFSNWTESNSGGGTAIVQSAGALSGTASMHLVASAAGEVNQSLAAPLTDPFDFTLSFSALAPSNDGGTTRTMNFYLVDSAGSNKINFRVIRPTGTQANGDIQVYNGAVPGGSWKTPLTNVVKFSSDLTAPVLNTLDVSGKFSGSSSTYTLTVDGVTSSAINYFQVNTPSNLNNVIFTTANTGTVDYVVDNVALTPEPTSLSLLGCGALGLLRRRRRMV